MRVSFTKLPPSLALSLALALAGLTSAPVGMTQHAHAACSPASGDDIVAICVDQTTNQGGGVPGNSTGTDGYGTGTEDGVTVTVDEGATVTGTTNGIHVGDDSTLLNQGTIQSTNTDGILAAGTIQSLVNDGLISSGRTGVWVDSGNLVYLLNNGTIRSGSNGSEGDGDGVYIVGTIQELINTVLIDAERVGVYANGGPIEDLQNSGTILSGGDGILSTNANIESLINTGLIDAGRHGVYAFQGDIVSLHNSGTIRSVGHGIRTFDGEIYSVINAGVIDGGDYGVYSQNNGIEFLSNSGTISGQTNSAVRAAQTVGRLENSGVIEGATNGVSGNAGVGWLSNSGRITASGGAALTTSTGSIGTVTNSGTMFGTVDGVYAEINIDTLTNSGFIGSDFIGVRAYTGGIGSLTNSGTIQGVSFAIQEQGAGNTSLTLNAGSVLIGRVDLGGGTNTLNIGEGLSLNSTFEDPDGNSTVPILGTTSGHLLAILDQATGGGGTDRQVVAVDPSAFASMDDALAALTAGIGQTMQGRQTTLRSDPALGFASRFAAADETSLAAFSDLDLDGAPHLNPNRFWIEGFGSFRQDESDRVGGDFDSLTGGLVAGVDVPVDAITSIGVMAGFAASTSENEIDTQTTDATSYFGGIYASTQAGGIFWDASLTVGYTDYDQTRITANNLVANGLETARADFGGWFINPQVTMTREAANPLSGSSLGSLMATNTLEQILTLSYAGLFLDGYTETGTTNPLTLDDRSIHVASARAELALPFEAINADGALTTLRLIGGVEARTQFGDDTISGTLLGQSVTTTLDDDDFTAGGFLGLSGEYQTTTGLTAYANAEGLIETDASWQVSATAGLRIAF